MSSACRGAGALLAAASLALVAGCGGDHAVAPQPTTQPAVTTPAPTTAANLGAGQAWAWPEEGLVVPIQPSPGALKTGYVTVKVGSAEVLAPVRRILPDGPSPVDADPLAARARSWVLENRSWRAAKPDPSLGAGGGFWVAAIPAWESADDAKPDRLTIDGKAIRLNWASPDADLREALLDAAPELSPFLTKATDALLASPIDRWRAKVASGRELGVDDDAPIADPVIAGLARQEEAAWLGALGRVWTLDQKLAIALAKRLTRVVRTTDDGGGAGAAIMSDRVPMWTIDPASERALRDKLLDARTNDDAALTAARVFIALPPALLGGGGGSDTPIGGAVVLDDAGSLGAAPTTGRDDGKTPIALPAAWVVNFSDDIAAAGVRRVGGVVGNEELSPLAPLEARRMYVPGRKPVDDDNAAPRPGNDRRTSGATTGELAIRVGEWSAVRTSLGQVIPARPPGVTIGPMFNDWSMVTLPLAATESRGIVPLPRVDPRADVAGRLYREPAIAGATNAQPASATWTLYLEVRWPAEAGDPKADRVDIHLGPPGSTMRVLTLMPSGEMTVRTGSAPSQPAGTARISTLADRWIAWVPVPSQAISTQNVLQVGLVRTNPLGQRSAWPRPMLPWLDEPGRVAVDVTAW